MNSEYRTQPDNAANEPVHEEPFLIEDFVAPGIPIVRSSTPRPLSFGLLPPQVGPSDIAHSDAADFPMEAPTAPPLPEEFGDERDGAMSAVTEPVQVYKTELPNRAESEFLWLFEYGLDMDVSSLNKPERLNGAALLYGPAVLRNYQLVFSVEVQSGKVFASILAGRKPEAEVWGVLYRIPRRLIESEGDEASILDKAHLPGNFEPLKIVVHEMYRKRDIPCITYIPSCKNGLLFQLLPYEPETFDFTYVEQLLECAKQQKLPEKYLQELARHVSSKLNVQPPTSPLPAKENIREESLRLNSVEQTEVPVGLKTREQNTEPLPVVTVGTTAADVIENSFSGSPQEDEHSSLTTPQSIHIPAKAEEKKTQVVRPGRWLMAFAFYLVLLLLTTLMLSVILALGFWNDIVTANFAPLGVPWFVLMYGLLGGCISSILMIGRHRNLNPPGYVILTWFARPYIGLFLAVMAYLLLNSGLFVLALNGEQRYAFFSLVGAAAGFSEGWIFFRRSEFPARV